MNIFVDENIEERYVEGLYEDFIFEEYEKIIFDYLANNCKEFDDEHIQHLVDLKVKQFFKLRKQITQLTNNWNELEDLLKIKKARMLNEPDYSKYYLEGYETAIQTTHSSHSGIMLETAKKSIVVLCDELLDKMKEIKERKNVR